MDWHLLPDSPAIDAGTDELYAPTDVDGDPRPAESGVDIGIDEHPAPDEHVAAAAPA